MNLIRPNILLKYFFVVLLGVCFRANASDFLSFKDGQYPYFENADYQVYIMSILNVKENVYVNLSIIPKKRFRHYIYYKLKKTDRTRLLLPWLIELTESDSTTVIGRLPYVGLGDRWAEVGNEPYVSKREYSANLNDKEINQLSLKFGGHISSNATKISLTHNGDEEYFSFEDIPVSFSYHKEWENKYSNSSKKDLIALIDASSDPICGVYDSLYACVPDGNSYNLVRIKDSNNMIWPLGDIQATFNRTAISGVYKGVYRDGTREKINDCTFVRNGDFLEIIYKYTEPGYMYRHIYIPSKEKEAKITYTKTYPINNNSGVSGNNIHEQWSGSGFALLKDYIITNYHVVDEAKNIEVFGIDGDLKKAYKANVIGKDKVSDLALLQIEDMTNIDYWNAIPYSIKTNMSDVGEPIYVMGYPLIGTMGDEVKLTTGVISSRSGFEGDVTTYQISAPIQPGNSGGPMLDQEGNVVGVVCAKHKGAENVGYAIKTSYLLNLIECVASLDIVPKENKLKGLSMKNQVKLIRDYTFLIKCSK